MDGVKSKQRQSSNIDARTGRDKKLRDTRGAAVTGESSRAAM